jgi:hypothetical protein
VAAEDPAAWSDFGLGLVGAAAALAGLIFVAISINLRQILSVPGLTGRAGEAILTLAFALVTCSLLLVPSQGRTALGVEWLLLTVGLFLVLLRLHVRAVPLYGKERRNVLFGRIFTHQTVVALFALASLGALTGSIGGLYWIAPAALWSLIVGIADGWVLLIEILR